MPRSVSQAWKRPPRALSTAGTAPEDSSQQRAVAFDADSPGGQRLLEVDRFKNRFLGMAAHDLRGPLGNILISAEMLLAGFHGHLNPEQADLLKELAASAVGMKKLVNDLLDVSAIEAGSLTLEPRPCAPAAVLRAGLRGRRFPAARKKIDLVEDFSPSVPESFLLDPDRLRQVIDNLVGNAVKFSPPGTRVTLEASACPEGLLVSVRDQGPGLDEDAAGLFEPFARGGGAPPPGEKSVGLGLAIAKRIVEAHGGRIWAENAPDRGAVVRFTIPSQ